MGRRKGAGGREEGKNRSATLATMRLKDFAEARQRAREEVHAIGSHVATPAFRAGNLLALLACWQQGPHHRLRVCRA